MREKLGLKSRCEALTADIDFGRIDSHTRPVRMLVTAKPSVKRSDLDCELHNRSRVNMRT